MPPEMRASIVRAELRYRLARAAWVALTVAVIAFGVWADMTGWFLQ